MNFGDESREKGGGAHMRQTLFLTSTIDRSRSSVWGCRWGNDRVLLFVCGKPQKLVSLNAA